MGKDCPVLKNLVALVGRVFVSIIFIVAGVQKIVAFKTMSALLATMKMPYAEWLLIVAIIFELGGALLLFFGWFARFGSVLLIIFVVVATFLFHSFWTFQGAPAVNQTHHFLKNLSILGGLLYVLAYGAGCYSFDGYRKKSNAVCL